MAVHTYYTSDIRQGLTAGLVLAIETANAQGCTNVEYIGGILTMAKYQALAFGIPWTFVVNDARLTLSDNLGNLLGNGNPLLEDGQ